MNIFASTVHQATSDNLQHRWLDKQNSWFAYKTLQYIAILIETTRILMTKMSPTQNWVLHRHHQYNTRFVNSELPVVPHYDYKNLPMVETEQAKGYDNLVPCSWWAWPKWHPCKESIGIACQRSYSRSNVYGFITQRWLHRPIHVATDQVWRL